MISQMINSPLAVSAVKEFASRQTERNNHKTIIYIGSTLTDTCIKLEQFGYRVLIAGKCEAGRQKLFSSFYQEGILPDIFIGDAGLVKEDNGELFGTLHAFNEFRNIPFLLIASSRQDVDFLKSEGSYKIDDIVTPDISIGQLHEKIRLLKKVRELRRCDPQPKIAPLLVKRVYHIDLLLKKALDKLVAFSAIVILSPLMLLIALAIKLDSRGPVFYISRRAGWGYRIFRFYKFRTMVIDADTKLKEVSHLNQYDANPGGGPVFIKVNNDPRITRLGVFLRKTSLDELPQLINVLKGDMSLVGNRPLPLYEASTLTTDRWSERFMAPAGITGLWQISKRGKKDMSVDERIGLDIDYAHKNSFLYDLLIMWHTPSALVQKENV